MIKWFLNKLDQKGRKYIIYDREGKIPYLNRYYIAYEDSTKRERRDINFNVFLHQFLQSDDPVFHTHPWNWYLTIVLKGGYWAHTPWGTKWYGPGSVNYVDCLKMKWLDESQNILLPANLHWVEIPKSGKTWTLFTRGKTVNDGFWGFWSDENSSEIIQHEKYLESKRKF